MDILNGPTGEVKHQTGQSGQIFGGIVLFWGNLYMQKLEISG
jgi:hypothetical protein